MKLSAYSQKPRMIMVATVANMFDTALSGQPRALAQEFDLSLATSPGEIADRVALQEGVRIAAIPIARNISPFRDIVSIFRLYRHFRSERPAIIQSFTPKGGLVAMIAGWLARVPVRVHTFTGLIFPSRKGIMRQMLILTDRLTVAMATHIVPESKGVQRDLTAARITGKPLVLIGNGNIAGVDCHYNSLAAVGVEKAASALRTELKIPTGAFVFCFIGRLNRDKGLDELIAAFCRLPDAARLLVLGREDPSAPARNETIAEVDANPRIHRLGFLSDVRPAIVASNVVVLPSYREGFPNVLLEAFALSRPMIVTDINGSNELVEPTKTGWIVPVKDAASLGDAMLQALELCPANLCDMGTAARNNVEKNFDRRAHQKRLIAFYMDLLENAL